MARMKLTIKSKWIIGVASVAILGILISPLLLIGAANSDYKGMYIDSVVMTFQAARSNLIENNQLENPEGLYKEWIKFGVARDTTKVVFGRTGEIAVFSERYNMVILFQPLLGSSNKQGWSCLTYPRISRKTLCSMLE